MRIILADHHQSSLWALRTLLAEEPGLHIVGEAADVQQLQTTARCAEVDLVLLDRRLPGGDIKSVITSIHNLARRPVVVVMVSEQEDGRLMLRAGADAVVSKGDQPEWLLETVRHYAARQNRGT